MATKTKTKSTVAAIARLQTAVSEIEATEAYAKAHIPLSETATRLLRKTKATISQEVSRLRHLLEAQEHGRSPHQRPGAKPAKRKDVDGALPNRPSVGPRSPKARSRKRVARKQVGEDSTALTIWRIDNDDL